MPVPQGARDEVAGAIDGVGGCAAGSGQRIRRGPAWTEAVKSDTLAAYAAFAMTFPDSEHAAAAHRELSGQQWAALDDEAAAGRSLLGYGGVAAGSPSSTQLPLWRAEY